MIIKVQAGGDTMQKTKYHPGWDILRWAHESAPVKSGWYTAIWNSLIITDTIIHLYLSTFYYCRSPFDILTIVEIGSCNLFFPKIMIDLNILWLYGTHQKFTFRACIEKRRFLLICNAHQQKSKDKKDEITWSYT